LTTLTYALGFGTIFLGLAALAAGVLTPSHPARGWAAILYLALVTTLLAQSLYLAGLRQVETGRASLVATVEPVVAAVLGAVLLRERLDVSQIAGGMLVLSAVTIAQRLPTR
jgi:drug/metabolite transporter (DMT)-like permease